MSHRPTRKHVSRNQIGFLMIILVFVGPSLTGLPSLFQEMIFREPSCTFSMDLAAEAQMNTLSVALAQYKTLNRTPPTTEEGLTALVQPPVNARSQKKLFVADAIRDPWGRAYQYRHPAVKSEGRFDLWSSGPDGKDGTDDDIWGWK